MADDTIKLAAVLRREDGTIWTRNDIADTVDVGHPDGLVSAIEYLQKFGYEALTNAEIGVLGDMSDGPHFSDNYSGNVDEVLCFFARAEDRKRINEWEG